MNIFTPHRNPRKCARALDDIRLRKMVLETAQMLCTAVNLKAGEQVTPYKNSHPTNHLVTWARKKRNWAWLWLLGVELGAEYHRRFGKAHASFLVIQALPLVSSKFGYNPIEDAQPKDFPNAASHQGLGLSFRHIKDHRKAYRKYLRARWKLQSKTKRKNGKIYPPVWTKGKAPKWK